MSEHYVFRVQARPQGQGQSSSQTSWEEEQHGSHRDMASSAGQQEQQQYPSPAPSPLLPSPMLRVEDPTSAPAPNSVDHLAQEWTQNLRLDDAGPVAQRLRQSRSSTLPSPDISCLLPYPELEVDDEPQRSSLLYRRDRSSLSLSMDVDDSPSSAIIIPDFRRLQRHNTSRFHNNPRNSHTIQTHISNIVSGGSSESLSNPAPAPAASGPGPLTPSSSTKLSPVLEPESEDCEMFSCIALEVDEAYAGGACPEVEIGDLTFIENLIPVPRRAGTPTYNSVPPGFRKHGPLRYRASADAALRCANVVRNRPRMRKRKKLGPNSRSSIGSSSGGITSTFSSPVIPPSLPESDDIF